MKGVSCTATGLDCGCRRRERLGGEPPSGGLSVDLPERGGGAAVGRGLGGARRYLGTFETAVAAAVAYARAVAAPPQPAAPRPHQTKEAQVAAVLERVVEGGEVVSELDLAALQLLRLALERVHLVAWVEELDDRLAAKRALARLAAECLAHHRRTHRARPMLAGAQHDLRRGVVTHDARDSRQWRGSRLRIRRCAEVGIGLCGGQPRRHWLHVAELELRLVLFRPAILLIVALQPLKHHLAERRNKLTPVGPVG